MPQIGVPQPPSRAPPRVGMACAYLSWSVPITELDRLPEKLEGEPCARGIVVGPVGTRSTS
jgi:hypothetical protein